MAKQKRIGMIALGAVFCLLLGASSFAATVSVHDTIKFDWAPGHPDGFNGGAFTATVTTLGPNYGFFWYSFCVEKNEYIDLSSSFIVESISGTAWNGGLGVSDPGTPLATGTLGDPISNKTAFLYYKYATGGILGVEGAGTGAQQKALQKVFWYLENEIVAPPSSTLGDAYLAIANAATVGNYYGVSVVNPTWDGTGGTRAQSQLVYIPESVPEAGALLLFGTGLVGLVGYRRARRMQ